MVVVVVVVVVFEVRVVLIWGFGNICFPLSGVRTYLSETFATLECRRI